jgi:hypothetical protein
MSAAVSAIDSTYVWSLMRMPSPDTPRITSRADNSLVNFKGASLNIDADSERII